MTTPKKKVAAPVKTKSAKATPAKKPAPAKAAPAKKAVAVKAPLAKKASPVKAKSPAQPQSKAKAAPPVAAKSKAAPPVATKSKAAPAAAKTQTPKKTTMSTSKKVPSAAPKAAAPTKASVVAASKPTPAGKAKVAPASSPQKATPVPESKSMSVKKVSTPSPALTPVVETVAVPAATSAPDQLVRATRPSARLAQITVPSLPPAVASTAAKSSFMPTTPAAVVAAPFAPIKKDPKLANNWKSKPVEALTDAEILAMSDDEYMNHVQMAYFRRKLSVLKQDILNSAGATTEHLREDTVVVPDPADRATIEEEHALELRTRDRERKLLKKIEQSIGLIDAGEYGYCDETGEPIGVGRLLARPTATLSLEAQQRRELKQKMFGD